MEGNEDVSQQSVVLAGPPSTIPTDAVCQRFAMKVCPH